MSFMRRLAVALESTVGDLRGLFQRDLGLTVAWALGVKEVQPEGTVKGEAWRALVTTDFGEFWVVVFTPVVGAAGRGEWRVGVGGLGGIGSFLNLRVQPREGPRGWLRGLIEQELAKWHGP